MHTIREKEQGLPIGTKSLIFASMALEIRRTPVLYGEEARRFLREIENPDNFKVNKTKEELDALMEMTKQIWTDYRATKNDQPS